MKTLIICFSFLGFFSFNDNATTSDGVETIVITCGNDPDGNWDCHRTNLNDGSDCVIVDNEGAPGGLAYSDNC